MNPLPLLPDLGPVPSLALAAGVLVLAYAIFALTGFGSALVASAPLATVMPVARIIPLLALLDCLGSARRGWRQRRVVDGPALRQLVPAMLLGQWLGVGLLTRLPAGPMAVLLGGFVCAYGLHALLPGRRRPPGQTGRFAGLAHGLAGGILGGLFGSGGFLYASHLERRLPSRDAFRATQAVLIALSTAWRLLLCAAAGLIDGRLLGTALLLLPAALLGGRIGQQVDLHLAREQLSRLLHLLLIASGLLLVLRHLA